MAKGTSRSTSALALLLMLMAAAASAQTTVVTADKVRATGNLTISPVGDVVFNAGGKDIYPAANYDQNLGLLNAKYLTVHAAELWVETLVAQNTLATIGGRVLVAPTTILTSDVTVGATSITVKYNNLANGDRIYLEANGKVEWMAVTSAASGGGPYTYSVTRNLDGSGADAWYAGDAVLSTGTTGNGFIDLYSVRGVRAATEYGPSIVGNVRTGTTYSQTAPRWAIGNMNGLFGYSATTYGAAFGDPANTWLAIDATNGVRGMSGASTERFHLAADGSGHLGNGNLFWDTSGVLSASGWTINAAAIAKDTGTNGTSSGMAPADYPFYAGATYASRASAPFRVTPAGALVATDATITGAVTATSGSFTGTIYAGGATLSAGTLSFSGGGSVYGSGANTQICGGGNCFGVDGSGINANGKYIGVASDIHTGDLNASGTLVANVINATGELQSNGTAGASNSDWACGGTVHLQFAGGLFYGGSCSEPEPGSLKAQAAEIGYLRQELAALRALVTQLLTQGARQ